MNGTAKPRQSKKTGLPPGSLVYTGTKAAPTRINLVRYDQENFNQLEHISIEEAIKGIGNETSNWLIISGFEDLTGLEKLGNHFGISPLIMEDIFNVQHLPKVEDDDRNLFVTLKSLSYNDSKKNIEAEQISLFLGSNILITFQEKESSLFELVIDHLKNGKGKGRLRQEDFLAYLIIDHIVDQYYILLDHYEEQMEQLESLIFESPAEDVVHRFLHFKKGLIELRKAIYPLKEEIRYLSREESDIIKEITRQHLGDIHDHLSHIIQSLDSYREMVATMMDLHAANASNRMSSIMKTLTLVSTTFIPLTFAAGIYGMNFRFMPELEWKYGYPVFLVIVLGIGLGMYFYMKQKRWF